MANEIILNNDNTTHNVKITDPNQNYIFIDNKNIAVKNAIIPGHDQSDEHHSTNHLINTIQNYIFIDNKNIAINNSTFECGASAQNSQTYISIN